MENTPKLYFAPLACSLASRIALRHAGIDATYVQVGLRSKRLPDGSDYHAVNPLGSVPALLTDDGRLITENAAILHHVLGDDEHDPTELIRWLSFIATELHASIFAPLFDPQAPEEVKRYALEKAPSRLAFAERHLESRDYVLDALSAADMYLYTVLNWVPATPIKLDDYPALSAYHKRMAKLPAVAEAFAIEFPLYQADQRADQQANQRKSKGSPVRPDVG